ncbi:sialoadhesin-like [Colossoma macropomum]|uniref:sialoadhesin-like n=1 Tax=Colossoma macropomum TaxID=42526 RepID=UPI0018654A7F|nr:sialoadhesin-like [Colossoma macropomum]
MISRTSGNITAAVIVILLTGVQAQHSVTLSSQSLCAVTGSTVKISCKYTAADSSRVREREWYQLQSSDGEERVLSQDPQYSARVSVRTEQNDCDLTVRDVRLRDSGVYNFRFRTSSSDWISASSGVNLTVTELQVKVDRKTAGQRKVKLTCSSTCSLDENLTYDWYRNGEFKPDTGGPSIVLDSTRSSDEGSYFCGLFDSSGKFHRSPPQRSAADAPLTTGQNYTITNISSQHSGLYYCTAHNQLGQHSSTPTHLDVLYPPRPPSVNKHIFGDSVTLVCVSDSNPASSYTWYKKTGSDVILIGNSTNITLPAGEFGVFFCKAENRFGSSNSSECLFTADNTAVKYAASAVGVVLLLILFAAFLWMRRKRGAERDTDIQTPDPADHTYTALKPTTMSSIQTLPVKHTQH